MIVGNGKVEEMGRELKRVPLNFNYTKNKVWYGYYLSLSTCMGDAHCEQCKEMARIKGVPMASYGCPDWDKYLEEPMKELRELLDVPKGEGYQLWETTSEGSPISPVFETLDELCEWCEENATTFGCSKARKEEWKEMLSTDFVYHKEGNAIFI